MIMQLLGNYHVSICGNIFSTILLYCFSLHHYQVQSVLVDEAMFDFFETKVNWENNDLDQRDRRYVL